MPIRGQILRAFSYALICPRDLVEGGGLKLLERMDLEVENWVETVERYGSIYHRVAGKVENLKRKALELGQRWVSGQGKSRWVFRLRRRKAAKPRIAWLRWFDGKSEWAGTIPGLERREGNRVRIRVFPAELDGSVWKCAEGKVGGMLPGKEGTRQVFLGCEKHGVLFCLFRSGAHNFRIEHFQIQLALSRYHGYCLLFSCICFLWCCFCSQREKR